MPRRDVKNIESEEKNENGRALEGTVGSSRKHFYVEDKCAILWDLQNWPPEVGWVSCTEGCFMGPPSVLAYGPAL